MKRSMKDCAVCGMRRVTEFKQNIVYLALLSLITWIPGALTQIGHQLNRASCKKKKRIVLEISGIP
jgi:hypothetical protein